MERIKNVWSTFISVTTLVVFASAVYITIFWKGAVLNVGILWQILGTSFVCSLAMLMVDPQGGGSRKKGLLINILYYLYVNVVVLSAGFLFQWFYPGNLPMVVGMLVLIAAVFVCIRIIFYRRDKALAARMMERLEEKCKSE